MTGRWWRGLVAFSSTMSSFSVHHCARCNILLTPARRTLVSPRQAPFVSFWYLLAPSSGAVDGSRPAPPPWWRASPCIPQQRHPEAVGAAHQAGVGAAHQAGVPMGQHSGQGPSASSSAGRVHPLGSLPMHLRDTTDPARVRAKPGKGPRLSKDGRPLCKACGQIAGLCKHTLGKA